MTEHSTDTRKPAAPAELHIEEVHWRIEIALNYASNWGCDLPTAVKHLNRALSQLNDEPTQSG
jgi:hypothetical protein